jgi:hypothetical protein
MRFIKFSLPHFLRREKTFFAKRRKEKRPAGKQAVKGGLSRGYFSIQAFWQV